MFEKDRKETPPVENFYETGRTRPPKSHGGVIATLLIAVIFLGGIFSAMDSLNLAPHHHQDSNHTAENCLHFSRFSQLETTASQVFDQNFAPGRPSLGFTGETLTNLDRQIYRLPKGIYITHVAPGAAAQGIVPGDVLLHLDGTPITDLETLTSALDNYSPGDVVKVILFRDGKQQTLVLKLTEEKG